jgi:hypothetical protein
LSNEEDKKTINDVYNTTDKVAYLRLNNVIIKTVLVPIDQEIYKIQSTGYPVTAKIITPESLPEKIKLYSLVFAESGQAHSQGNTKYWFQSFFDFVGVEPHE